MKEDSGKPTQEGRKEWGKGVMTRTWREEGKEGQQKDSNRQSRKEYERLM